MASKVRRFGYVGNVVFGGSNSYFPLLLCSGLDSSKVFIAASSESNNLERVLLYVQQTLYSISH
jgi:hypothetical protein